MPTLFGFGTGTMSAILQLLEKIEVFQDLVMSCRNPSSSANLVGKNGVKPGATRGFFFLSSLSFLLVCSLLVHSKKQQPVHKCGL